MANPELNLWGCFSGFMFPYVNTEAIFHCRNTFICSLGMPVTSEDTSLSFKVKEICISAGMLAFVVLSERYYDWWKRFSRWTFGVTCLVTVTYVKLVILKTVGIETVSNLYISFVIQNLFTIEVRFLTDGDVWVIMFL